LSEVRARRALGAREIRLFLLAGVIGLDTIGAAAQAGGQALTWLVALVVLFLVPYALLVAELGSAFPRQGGPYVWVRLAFGRPAAALAALLYWIANPIWLGGTLSIVAVSVFESFFLDLGSARYVFAVAFIWAAVAAVLAELRVGSAIAASGAVARLALLALLTVSTLVYAVANGVHGIALSGLEPTGTGLVVAVPLLIFGFLGLELASTASDELRDPARDVASGVRFAARVTALAYVVPLAALLFVLPVGDTASIGGFVDAIRAVFTVYGGHIDTQGTAHLTGAGRVLADLAAIGFLWTLLTGGATWLIGSSRVQAVAGADGAAPRALGRLSARRGAPAVVAIASGVVATIVMTMTYELASGRLGRYFQVMLGLGISTVLLAYLLVFPSLIRLRRTHPDVARPFAVPGGDAGAWICSILTTAVALFAAIELIYPGLGLAHPDALLPPSFQGLRTRYEEAMAIPLASIVALVGLGLLAGRRAPLSDV
jgi:amino acid transporter